MVEDEKIIWDYLDGQLSERQRAIVTKRLETDLDFKSLYVQRHQLHESLSAMSATVAPEHLLSNIMVSVNSDSISKATATNFSGLRKLGLLFLAISSVLVGWSLLGENSSQTNLLDDRISHLLEPLAGMGNLVDLNWASPNIGLYSLLLILLMVIFWTDHILTRLRLIRDK